MDRGGGRWTGMGGGGGVRGSWEGASLQPPSWNRRSNSPLAGLFVLPVEHERGIALVHWSAEPSGVLSLSLPPPSLFMVCAGQG